MEAAAGMVWKGNKSRGAGWLVCVAGLVGLGSPARAQQPASTQLATSVSGELQSLAARASVAFAGQVASVERRGGVVEISIRVEQTLRGSAAGTYTLREWAGLWPQGQFRYSVGERALFFLHAAGGAGFSSPVNGAEGVIPLVMQGANAPELLDIRRVAAALLRTPGTPLPTEAQAAIEFSEAVTLVAAATQAGGMRGGRLHEPVRLPLPRHVLPAPVAGEFPSAPATVSMPVAVGNRRRAEELHASR